MKAITQQPVVQPGRRALLGLAVAWAAVGTAVPAVAQAPDRVITAAGSISGEVVAVSPQSVDVEDRAGETKKVPVDGIREVQFGGEPPSLRSARALLVRGRAADALEELAKVDAAELDGAEQLVLDDMDFVKAAAAARAALASNADPRDAGKLVQEFLTKHPQSHHVYEMQELIGDLLARAGKPDLALAAYVQLAKGPPAFQVRAAAAKGAMLYEQKKFAEALAEYEAAVKIDATDDASALQKLSAKLGMARCLMQTGKHDEAVKLVQGVVKQADPEDKEVLARAYNALGDAYRAAGDKDQDALIAYLTVDLVYNTAAASHAEALYNLAGLWEKVKNPERAREARKMLEDTYPTTPWAKKAAGGS